MARWEHQTETPSPGPMNGGQSSASFVTPGTEAEWTGYAENVSPQLSEASFDSMVCDCENLAQLRCDYKMSLLGKGNKAYFMKICILSPKGKIQNWWGSKPV